MIVTIKTVEEISGDYGIYQKVVGIDGAGKEIIKNVSDKFKDKWLLLVENATVEFKMTQKDKKWRIVDILPVSEQLAEPTEPEVLPEHQEAIDKAKAEAPPPAPQAVGMITKEIGDMIRAKYLRTIFGDEAQIELLKWYRGQVLAITRIKFDGAKLPTFEKQQKPVTIARPEDDIPEDEIPF